MKKGKIPPKDAFHCPRCLGPLPCPIHDEGGQEVLKEDKPPKGDGSEGYLNKEPEPQENLRRRENPPTHRTVLKEDKPPKGDSSKGYLTKEKAGPQEEKLSEIENPPTHRTMRR